VRRLPTKAAPKLTSNTEKALDKAKLPRGKKVADEEDLDWGNLPSNTDRATFEQRKIGTG
jgi:hypothetical protein